MFFKIVDEFKEQLHILVVVESQTGNEFAEILHEIAEH